MATSLITFEGNFDLSSTTAGSASYTFTPPSNLAGELCYGKVEIFRMKWDTLYSSPGTMDSFLISQDGWSVPQSAKYKDGVETGGRPPIAQFNINGAEAAAPFLFMMPESTHTLTFDVRRIDGGAIAAATTNKITYFIAMNIVRASSRQMSLVM